MALLTQDQKMNLKTYKSYVTKGLPLPAGTRITKDYKIKSTGSDCKFTITNETVDRDGDVVVAAGLDVSSYLTNPVVLWGHDTCDAPIGRCTSLNKIADGWEATVEFVPADNPYNGYKAEGIRQMLETGFLHAVSIGFIPKDAVFNDEGGMEITKAELTEFSIVSVPCNPDALIIRDLNTTEPLIPEDVTVEEDEEIEEADELQHDLREEKRRKYLNNRFKSKLNNSNN